MPLWKLLELVNKAGKFSEYLHPDAEMAKEFWLDFKKQPYAKSHCVHEFSDDQLSRCVPLHFHCDGVKVFKGSGMVTECSVWSASSAMVRATSMRSKWLIVVIPVHLQSRDTVAFVTFFLRFLVKILRLNVEPRQLENGKLCVPLDRELQHILPLDHCMLLAGLKSDMKEKLNQHMHHAFRYCTRTSSISFSSLSAMRVATDVG